LAGIEKGFFLRKLHFKNSGVGIDIFLVPEKKKWRENFKMEIQKFPD
jgi:hypothetical protein